MKNILKKEYLKNSCLDITKQPERFKKRVEDDFEIEYNGKLDYIFRFENPTIFSYKDNAFYELIDGELKRMSFHPSENDLERVSLEEFNERFNDIGNDLKEQFHNKAIVENELQMILSPDDVEKWFVQLLSEQKFSEEKTQLIMGAKDLCKLQHKGQLRDEGIEYYSHPLFVAIKGMELGLNYEDIISLLLHDTIEDTELTHAEIETRFGATVADNILGLSKKDSGKELLTKEEYYKRIYDNEKLAILKGLDRLANLYSLNFATAEKQERYLEETKNIIIPIVKKHNGQLAEKIEWLIDYIENEVYELSPEIKGKLEDLKRINKIKGGL